MQRDRNVIDKDKTQKKESFMTSFMKEFVSKEKENVSMKTENYTKLKSGKKQVTETVQKEKKNQKNKTSQTLLVKLNFSAFSRSAKRAKRSLPKDGNQKKVAVTTLFKEYISCSPKKVRFISKW